MVGFTSRQTERAELSRKIYINLGLPNLKNFKHMLSTNMKSNCLISVAYISNYEKIYESFRSSFKGKSTSSKPRSLIKDDIQIISRI